MYLIPKISVINIKTMQNIINLLYLITDNCCIQMGYKLVYNLFCYLYGVITEYE